MPVNTQTFREAMAHHAASVAIVTCRDRTGEPAGLTATSMTSLLDVAHAELAADFAAFSELRFTLPGLETLEDGLTGVGDSVARFACRTVDVHDHAAGSTLLRFQPWPRRSPAGSRPPSAPSHATRRLAPRAGGAR